MYLLLSIAALLLSPTAYGLSGARNTSIENHPYNVVFHTTDGVNQCNGAIISERWVITTYDNCASKLSPETWKTRAGSSLRSKGGSVHKIEKIVKHENNTFSTLGLENNAAMIALVKVKEPFVLDETRRVIKLFNATEKLTPGTVANVSGFGWNSNSESLQSVELPIMDLEICKLKFGAEDLEEGLVCAGYGDSKVKKGVYAGDEGDPVVVEGRLAAMVALPFSSTTGRPALCTDIAHYRHWIDRHVEL